MLHILLFPQTQIETAYYWFLHDEPTDHTKRTDMDILCGDMYLIIFFNAKFLYLPRPGPKFKYLMFVPTSSKPVNSLNR